MAARAATRIHESHGDRILNATLYTIFTVFIIIVLYPLIFVVSSSFSSGSAVSAGRVILWPVEPGTLGYEMILSSKFVWTGFRNSLLYTVLGTALNMLVTIPTAYGLARRNLQGKGVYMTIFMIPMFFGGGLIPSYILMTQLHLNGTMWAVVLTGTLNIYNMILMRTYFQNSIPNEIFEAAKIDGISDFGYLFRITLPLSKSILAVITLYYSVGHWNSYFTEMLYLRDRDLYPLQLVLRSILQSVKVEQLQISDGEVLARMIGANDLIKYAMVVVSTVPILLVYPFVAKYFQKGVMIGSVKG